MVIPSKETRKKLSEATRGKNNPNYGKYHSDETKRKMSEARIGKYKGKDHPNYGKKMSEDQKKKISEARKGRYAGKDNPKARAVIINNKYFDTRKEAAKCLGVTPALIRYRIMHETKWLDYSYAQI
jgi:group I intron endonuclease